MPLCSVVLFIQCTNKSKWLCHGSVICCVFFKCELSITAHLSFIFDFSNTNESVFLYHRHFHVETQTNPTQRPPELPVQSKSNSLFLCITLAKLLIIYWTILSNYQSSVGVIVGCEVQPPTVWLKWLFFFPLPFFFGLKSSALNWSEPSGHRLRCSQNFNASFSIVWFRESCQVPQYLFLTRSRSASASTHLLFPAFSFLRLCVFMCLSVSFSLLNQLSFAPHSFGKRMSTYTEKSTLQPLLVMCVAGM